jgi:hypothetical protein
MLSGVEANSYANEESPDVPIQNWVDLAGVRPGTHLEEQAVALRQAAPSRTFLARMLRVHTEERAYRIGGKGERQVGSQLDKLGPRWHALHSIVISETGTDIDHLVIGPGGVFCINSKNRPGKKVWVGGDTVLVSGQKQAFVRTSRNEGKKVSRILEEACGHPVLVTPMIVIANGELTVKEQPRGVRFCSRRRLPKWLREHPQVLSDGEVERIFSIARRSTTWI